MIICRLLSGFQSSPCHIPSLSATSWIGYPHMMYVAYLVGLFTYSVFDLSSHISSTPIFISHLSAFIHALLVIFATLIASMPRMKLLSDVWMFSVTHLCRAHPHNGQHWLCDMGWRLDNPHSRWQPCCTIWAHTVDYKDRSRNSDQVLTAGFNNWTNAHCFWCYLHEPCYCCIESCMHAYRPPRYLKKKESSIILLWRGNDPISDGRSIHHMVYIWHVIYSCEAI